MIASAACKAIMTIYDDRDTTVQTKSDRDMESLDAKTTDVVADDADDRSHSRSKVKKMIKVAT